MKIVLPDYIYFTPAHETQLKTLGEVTIYDDIPQPEDVIKRIAQADIITTAWVDISETIINSNPNLKYIIIPGVGYDAVDLKAATQAGVKVINCPTHNTLAVAEYTLALILVITRKLVAANLNLKSGQWQTQDYVGTELNGKTLGLIGYGNTGRTVANLAKMFGMNINYANSKTPSDQLDDLIATSDILSLHLPVTTQSKHLIDARRLALMKPSAYLINTARGAIVDQQALFNVLKSGKIAGAALDVFENEPVGGTPNNEILELVQLDNVIATPHIAYNTEESAVKLGEELLNNIRACLQGNPINVVN